MQRRHLRLACDQRRRRVDVRRKAVARRSPALRREPFALGPVCLSVGIPGETVARRQAAIGVLAPAPALAAAFLTAANARPCALRPRLVDRRRKRAVLHLLPLHLDPCRLALRVCLGLLRSEARMERAVALLLGHLRRLAVDPRLEGVTAIGGPSPSSPSVTSSVTSSLSSRPLALVARRARRRRRRRREARPTARLDTWGRRSDAARAGRRAALPSADAAARRFRGAHRRRRRLTPARRAAGRAALRRGLGALA